MDAESYILKLNQGLDEIVARDFDFTRCGELLPNAKELTLSARLEVARNLHLDRPEFSRRVDIEVATTWEANEELAAVTAAKESLVRTLVDEEQSKVPSGSVGNKRKRSDDADGDAKHRVGIKKEAN